MSQPLDKGIWQYLSKLHKHLLLNPTIVHLEIYHTGTTATIYKGMCITLLIALFLITKLSIKRRLLA